MQPQVTDSHLGTAITPQQLHKIDEEIFTIYIYMITEDNFLPSVCELVISLSSPVKPPSLLEWTERQINHFMWLMMDRLLENKLIQE